MTKQMKAIEQFFHEVLFIMLYKTLLTFKFADETSAPQFFHFFFFGTVILFHKIILSLSLWMKAWSVIIQIKATCTYVLTCT